MRILFLSPRQCWPAQGGAKLREYHFANALGQKADLTYVYFSQPGSPPLTREDLPFFREIVAVPKPRAYGLTNLIRGVAGRWPLVVLNYTSSEMKAAVDRLVTSAPYDLIHIDSTHMMRYGLTLSAAGHRVIYNWHNIESEAMQRYSTTVSSLPRRWYARMTAKKIGNVEAMVLDSAFGHVVCSQREREILQSRAPRARIAVVENGVDAAAFAGHGAGEQTATSIVFVGLMNYFPNVEAAISFARNVWPLIRKSLPDLRFSIVGATPTPAVQELANMEGITVTGTVPDVRPYYQNALAAVVPLRTGGGTRLKILEAMAAGVPVISTPLGAEGLAVTQNENILLAEPDDAESWIRHLTRLAAAKEDRARLVGAARGLVRSRYDWQTLGQALCATYETWLQEKA